MQQQKKLWLFDWITRNWQDVVAVLALVLYGFFLIGNLSQGNFLDTGYQDWTYHAMRLEMVTQHGMLSWENFWSNGINLWRSYQYLIYYILLGANKVLQLSIPKLMIWATIFVFIASRVMWYVVLRRVKVRPILAFVAVLASFYMIQQWSSIKDFSIYMVSFFLPFFVWTWVNSTQKKTWMLIVAPLAGFAWFLHPIMGLICSGLWGLSFLFLAKKLRPVEIIVQWGAFLTIAAGFFVPYFAYGYGFTHPVFASVEFLVMALQRPGLLGLSQLLLAMLVFSWIILVAKLSKLKRWYKILTLFSSLYLLAVVLGMRNFLPTFIMQLQFSRGVFLVGYLICFGFGYALEQIVTKRSRKTVLTLLALASAIIMTESVVWSADLSAPVTETLDNPVTQFLSTTQPKGNLYFRNPTVSTYLDFGKVRFVNSYNWHMEPNPYSYRYTQLLNTDFAFSSVSPSKLETLYAYTRVLNVEYLALPINSPLMRSLTDEKNPTPFTSVLTTIHNSVSYSFIRSPYNVAYAYFIPDELLGEVFSTDVLPVPTLHVNSFKKWDESIKKMHTGLNKEGIVPLSVAFPTPETIEVQLPTATTSGKVLVLQSHDPYWKATQAGINLESSNTHFIVVTPNQAANETTLTLVHHWPEWFWPLQLLSLGTTGVLIIAVSLYIFMNRHATEK